MPPNSTENVFNKDELEAPEFLNKELIATVLKKYENSEKVKVKNFKLTPASQKGDHYASIMFRANVEYEKEGAALNKPLIIKTMPVAEGHKKELLQESHIFETEIGMTTEVLPKFQKILNEVSDEIQLSAPVLHHSLNPYKIIIFEDLVPRGFEVIRGRLINEDEAKGAFTKLAKWHAVSYKLILEQPQYFDKYRHSFWAIPNVLENGFIKDGVTLFLELLHKHPTLSEYIPHFEAVRENILTNSKDKSNEYRENPQAGAYYVLCHGDFHAKNMMFKNNSKTGNFEDVMLLDFQMCHVGSIVNDLMYSYYMLLDAQLRVKFDEFLYFYFNIFTATLKKIGFKGTLPKLIELRKQWLDNKSFDLFLMATFMPLWEAMRDGDVETEELMTSIDYRRKLYDNKNYIKELHTLLPKLLHLGYFEK